jgi:hypothetical protein
MVDDAKVEVESPSKIVGKGVVDYGIVFEEAPRRYIIINVVEFAEVRGETPR